MSRHTRRIACTLSLLILILAGCAAPATPTPTPIPTPAPTATLAPVVTPQPGVGKVTFTVVFDNYAHNPELETDWGFACLIETTEKTVLFDTGADGEILLRNLHALGKDLEAIDVIVLSHEHGDHIGGMRALLATGVQPTIYVPAAFPDLVKDPWREQTEVVEVPSTPMALLPGFYSTGFLQCPVGLETLVEQALVVDTAEGWVVVTGCAHPGVVQLAQRAKEATGSQLELVMGGFHLVDSSQARIEVIINRLRELGVQRAAPSHCSGDRAREVFAQAFGDKYIDSGVGAVITLGP
jgi:7,8-dihydropterin-6-yl-methyl-4-(beta-D-ribofuranosyl)aminobenzene 5'-phosphate synthase